VPLNHLVDKIFTVGAVVFARHSFVRAVRPSRKADVQGREEGLLHRGGLRCEIVEGGTLAVGAAIVCPS